MAVARRLALGRLISLTGGAAAYIALIAAIYSETSSAAWVSAALFAGVFGSVVAAPAAGWIGDHFDRRGVLIGADLGAAVVAGAMALTDQPTTLIVLFGLLAVVTAPFEPASAAAMPNLVPTADVARANALVATTGAAGYLLGPLIGGVVVGAGASASTLFAVNAVSFLISALVVATIRRPFGSGATEEHPGVLAGFRVIVHDPSLRLLVAAGMAALVGIGIVNVASLPLSIELGGGTEGYGAMTALLGGGGLVGAAVAGRVLGRGATRVLVAAFAAGAVGFALAGAAPVLWLALAGMAVAGAGGGLSEVAATTLLQRYADDEVRSRVFAAQDGAAHLAFSLSAFAGGLIVELASARGAFAGAAVCAVGAVLIAVRIGTAEPLPR